MSNDGENPEPDALDRERLFEVYKEICNNVRVTDDISFKLLGTVPLAAGIGSGALTILEKNKLLEDYSEVSILALSVFGLLITIGLFRWELRNIQKCRWLMSRAAKLERLLFPGQEGKVQFGGVLAPEDVKRIRNRSNRSFVHIEVSLGKNPSGEANLLRRHRRVVRAHGDRDVQTSLGTTSEFGIRVKTAKE